MLEKRLGYRRAMLFQSTSSNRKPWQEIRAMRLPNLSRFQRPYHNMEHLLWQTLLTSPEVGPSTYSAESVGSLRTSAVTTYKKEP